MGNNHPLPLNVLFFLIKIRAYGEGAAKNEAERAQFIGSIMAAAVIFVSGTRLYAEKSVEGDDEHGRIDFGVTRLGDDQLICVTEAKIEDIRGGFAQALSALEGTLQVCMKMMSRGFQKKKYISR